MAALFFFSWTNLLVALVLYWVAVGFGISMGYHRLHTHRGYKTPKAFEYFLAVCGTLTLEGGPIFWVATHRMHHQHSDTDSDPHTPRTAGSGRTWAGFSSASATTTTPTLMSKYAPDLARDPFYRWLNTYHWVPLTVLGLRPARHRRLAAGLLGDLPARGRRPARDVARQLRDAHVGHAAASQTSDDSKNSWWVALLTFGEGWHNNHHAHPTSARHGLAWYEFDITLAHAAGCSAPSGSSGTSRSPTVCRGCRWKEAA